MSSVYMVGCNEPMVMWCKGYIVQYVWCHEYGVTGVEHWMWYNEQSAMDMVSVVDMVQWIMCNGYGTMDIVQ